MRCRFLRDQGPLRGRRGRRCGTLRPSAGEGPGEFGIGSSDNLGNLDLVRGEEGTIGVYDGLLFRFTIFEPSGAYVSDVRAQFLHPLRSFGTVLSGVVWRGWIADSLMTRYDVDIATGEVVREEASPSGAWGAGCGEGVWGIPDRAEGWAFDGCEGHLIFAGGTGDVTVLPVPTHLPDERDVARLEERLLAVHGSLGPEEMSRVLQGSPDGRPWWFWSTGRSARTMPTGSRTGRSTGTTSGTCRSAGDVRGLLWDRS